MTREQFWQLIEQVRSASDGDSDLLNELLEEKLQALPAEDIIGFQRIIDELMAASYRWDLWGAAYVMNSGCSDDDFVYFRGWLLSQGRELFEAALANPDEALAEVFDPDAVEPYENEGFLFAAHAAYEAKTDRDLYEDAAFDDTLSPDGGAPAGEPWAEDEAELARRFPKLYRKLSTAD